MTLNQLHLFIFFLIDGIIIGIIFDIFRILRKTFKHKDFVIYLQDILFWILTGILLLYTTFIFNDSEIRLYMILSSFLGFIIYLFTISKFFIKVSVKIILFIKNKIFLQPYMFLTINVRKARKKEGFWKKR